MESPLKKSFIPISSEPPTVIHNINTLQMTHVNQHISIRSPSVLQLKDKVGIAYGANQAWYSSWRGRMGGCGATAVSNLFWYLAESDLGKCGKLFRRKSSSREEMLRLMEAVFPYIKPGLRGVDKSSMLVDGAVLYGAKQGVSLSASVLEIPSDPKKRPSKQEVFAFLAAAFEDDLPTAFLNLSNGEIAHLENWHWVTLISISHDLKAEMYDQSRHHMIDLAGWLARTTRGGALVVLKPNDVTSYT